MALGDEGMEDERVFTSVCVRNMYPHEQTSLASSSTTHTHTHTMSSIGSNHSQVARLGVH